jgi:hypothetical protein
MLYFNSIPKILTPDVNGAGILLTNLMARSEIIPSLLNNPMMFYKYDIQEGDTPEIIADKYYGDSYRYWIVLYANQILDPQWNWPLTNTQFDAYITSKYSAVAGVQSVLAYTQSTIKEYRKTIKSIDSISLVETVDTFVIDTNTYSQPITSSATYQLPNSHVTQNISKSSISIYDYELEKNEAKRTINLINKTYVSELEQQFKSLMRK